MDLIERLIDEADGYGDGPVVVHDIEGLRALLREAAAEIERLRAEVGKRNGIDPWAVMIRAQEAEARAERLAEALRWYVENDDTNDGQEGNEFWLAGRDRARALLHDHDQEVGNG